MGEATGPPSRRVLGASRARALWAAPDGLGFDAGYTDQLREAIRAAVGQAAAGDRPTSTLDG